MDLYGKNYISLERLRDALNCTLEGQEWELLVLLTCCPTKQCNLKGHI